MTHPANRHLPNEVQAFLAGHTRRVLDKAIRDAKLVVKKSRRFRKVRTCGPIKTGRLGRTSRKSVQFGAAENLAILKEAKPMFRYALIALLFAAPVAAQTPAPKTGQKYVSYATGAAMAAAKQAPLVTFIGVKARPVAGAVVAHADPKSNIAGYDKASIVVSVPDGTGWLTWRAALPANATDAQIGAAMQRKAASQPARPFSVSPPFKILGVTPAPADGGPPADDSLERGPWPAKLAFPADMKRYKRAAWTQEIAVTNGQDRITPVPRTVLEPKYHQSGGMLGLKFRSDVYRNDVRPREWIGNIQVKNSFGYYQPNRGWKREYPAGARFMDVLSNVDTGKVFEVRKLEKHGPAANDWYIFVDYEDAAQRPEGYTGRLGVTCGSCHGDAGQGNYAAGLVIGGDFVLSDPIGALER